MGHREDGSQDRRKTLVRLLRTQRHTIYFPFWGICVYILNNGKTNSDKQGWLINVILFPAPTACPEHLLRRVVTFCPISDAGVPGLISNDGHRPLSHMQIPPTHTHRVKSVKVEKPNTDSLWGGGMGPRHMGTLLCCVQFSWVHTTFVKTIHAITFLKMYVLLYVYFKCIYCIFVCVLNVCCWDNNFNFGCLIKGTNHDVSSSNLIYRFKANAIKITASYFMDINKLILKCMWRGKRSRIVDTILKKNEVRGRMPPN